MVLSCWIPWVNCSFTMDCGWFNTIIYSLLSSKLFNMWCFHAEYHGWIALLWWIVVLIWGLLYFGNVLSLKLDQDQANILYIAPRTDCHIVFTLLRYCLMDIFINYWIALSWVIMEGNSWWVQNLKNMNPRKIASNAYFARL